MSELEIYVIKENIEALKTHLSEYLNTVWKTMTAIMIALGWLVSLDHAREFLTGNHMARIGAEAVVILLAALHFASLYNLYDRSKRTREALGEQDNTLMRSLVNAYSIPQTYPFASFLINALLFAILFGFIATT